MPDDRTRTADPHPDVATPPADAGATASDGRAATPDSTRPTSRPHGDAPTGVVSIPGYEVRGELARGGMGRVLEAFDLSFGREVAIKVVLPGPDAAATAGRFVRESRITGRLTHPGIPPAYQLGELPDGSPFLAMKLVRGRTLAQLLAERPDVGHDLPRFVSIFEQVCQAVGYAHSRGIIHRDLKPANVMVGAFGEVQVMDWGLAKVLADGADPAIPLRELPDSDTIRGAAGSTVGDAHTRTGAVLGTPAYMAPEQARGEDVDARADVFALGGLLTSILAGRAPFWSGDVNSTLLLASSGNTSEVLTALNGCGADAELVDLARHCVATEPGRRPADGTAAAGLVSAYRAGVEERLRVAELNRAAAEAKAAEQRKRRRVQLALAAAVLLLVAGAGGVAVWRVDEAGKRQAVALRLEGEERERRTRTADAVAALLDQAKAGLEAGDADRTGRLLDQATRRAGDEGVTDHADRQAAYQQDLAMLRALDGVNDFRWALVGMKTLPSSDEVADRWAAAFATWEIVPESSPKAAAARINGSTVRMALVAGLDRWLAVSKSAPVHDLLLATDPDPFRNDVRRLLAAGDGAGLAALVGRAEWVGQPSGLVQAYAASPAVTVASARALLRELAVARRTDFGLFMQLGATYPRYTSDGAGERARWYQAAAALRPDSLSALSSLGDALRDAGDLDGEVACLQEAARLHPANPSVRTDLGLNDTRRQRAVPAEAAFREAIRLDQTFVPAYNNLGVLLLEKGDRHGAEAAFREAIRLNPKFAPPHHGLGGVLADLNMPEAAVAAYREAIRLDPTYAQPHNSLGLLYQDQKRPDLAEEAYREAIRLDPKHALAHNNLGNVLLGRGKTEGAAAAYRESIRSDPTYSTPHNGLGKILSDKGELDGAEAEFREAIRLNPKYARAHNGLGIVLAKRGNPAGAEASYREAIRIDPRYPLPYFNLGTHYKGQLQPDKAESAYREALGLLPRNPSGHALLGDVLRMQGRHEEAADEYRAALAIQPALGYARDGLAYCLRVQRGEVPTAPPPRAVRR